MDKIALLPFLLQSFPENFIILFFGFVMIDAAPRFKPLIVVAACGAVFSYIVRALAIPFGVHSLVQLVFLIAAVYFVFQESVLNSVIVVLFGGIAMGLAETLIDPLIIRASGITFEQVMSDPWLRVFVPLPHMVLLGIAAWLSMNKNWALLPVGRKPRKSPQQWQRKDITYLILISLLQAFLFIALNLTLYNYYTGIFSTTDLQSLLYIGVILLLTAVGTTLVVTYYMLKTARKESQLEAEQRHIQGLHELYLAVRSQRHDFLNHVMSLYGLIKTENYATAKQYMESLYEDIKQSQEIINLGIPVLSGMLQTKKDIASKRGVDLKLTVDRDFADIHLAPVELNGIVGNLVDNALDAIEEYKPREPLIHVELLKGRTCFKIIVSNTGPVLKPELKNKIFAAGFSTKDNKRHSGIGLASVQSIVRKHDGKIEIEDPEDFEGVRFRVLIPFVSRDEG
ncbi:MAG: GHKL domain-containing protein [Thermoanaerobacteraceae bacterium]|nr:GHKL domain-containing protein [Thermoanaerobacteraceae bacterium]